jgi:hypothetical protein
MSLESKRKVQEITAEGVPAITGNGNLQSTPAFAPVTWDDFISERDVVHLYAAIRASHTGCKVGIPVLDMIDYITRLLTTTQEPGQTPSQFQQVLDRLNIGVASLGNGNIKPLPESFIAGLLLRGLSKEYDEVKTFLVNQCLTGLRDFPTTSAEVLQIVERYVSENKSVLVHKTSNELASGDKKGQKRKMEEANNELKVLLAKVADLKSQLDGVSSPAKPTSSKTEQVQVPSKDIKPSKPCGICNKLHYSFYCDQLSKEERSEQLAKWKAARERTKKIKKSDKKVHFTKFMEPPTDEGYMSEDDKAPNAIEVNQGNAKLFFTGEAYEFIEGPPSDLAEDSESDSEVIKKALIAKISPSLSTGDPEFDKEVIAAVSSSSIDELRDIIRISDNRSTSKRDKLAAVTQVYPDALVFDPGSEVSIVKDLCYINNVRRHHPVGINRERVVRQCGDNEIFGEMLYDKTFIANLLSMSEMLDRGMAVAYIPDRQVFIVTNPILEISVEFHRVGGLWVADASECFGVKQLEINFQSVDDRMKNFSKRANEQAKLAYDFMNSRQLSAKDATAVVQSIVGSPLSAIDFKRAEWIWGPAPSLNSRHRTTKPIPIDVESHLSSLSSVALSVDLMFMYDMAFLVSQSTPLNIKQCTVVKKRTKGELMQAIKKHFDVFKRYNKKVEIILSDGERGVVAFETKVDELVTKLDNARLNIEAAGSHVPYVENLIRYAKAKLRGFTNTSPLGEMPKAVFALIVCAYVESLNYLPCTANHGSICPWEALTQVRPTYDRYFKVAPGQFVWVVEPKSEVGYNNVEFDRMIPAIALKPTGSIRGAYKFFSLETGKLITRDKFHIGVVTDDIIQRLQSFEGNESAIMDNILETDDDVDFLKPTVSTVTFPTLDSVIQSSHQSLLNSQVAQPIYSPTPLMPPSSQLLLGDTEISNFNKQSRIKPPLPPTSMVTRSNPNFKFVYLTYNAAKKKLGKKVEQPVEDEIYQLLLDKKVFLPSKVSELSQADIKNAVRTHMLVDEKFLQSGLLDKIKARLVALGCHENPETIGESFAPTPFIQNIFALSAIAAKSKCKIRTLDVSGAFLNAGYLHKRQFVILNKQLADIVCKLDPQYESYRRKDGSMYCRLQKALYGLVEAAKLWNDEVSRVMLNSGFKPSFIDECVFTKDFDGVLCTVVVHVDDFKIMSTSEQALDFVENLMRDNFKKITVKNGLKHEFLGMLFDYSEEGFINITQSKFIQDVITAAGVTSSSNNPALPNLFKINPNSTLLPEKERKSLHTTICKAQYLAKRTRPDILPAIHFLSRRVNSLTTDDRDKMMKVAEYLNATKSLGLRLSVVGPLRVTVYIDASYATHADRKSHTGVCITLGCGMLFSSSKRQKINTKSACEAELVGLSDGMGVPIQLHNFLVSIGYKLPAILVMQDNTSTIQLAKNGRSNSDTTKHIDTRRFWITDRIKRGQIELKHTVTLEMIADVLTKPVQGLLFFNLRNRLLGYELPNDTS